MLTKLLPSNLKIVDNYFASRLQNPSIHSKQRKESDSFLSCWLHEVELHCVKVGAGSSSTGKDQLSSKHCSEAALCKLVAAMEGTKLSAVRVVIGLLCRHSVNNYLLRFH